METTPIGHYSGVEEWLQSHVKEKYRSCIKINGYPILPPLMTERRKIEMRYLREKAIELENKVSSRRRNSIPDDSAGGEALYEVANDELYFAASLPCSLNENLECQPHQNKLFKPKNEESFKETNTSKVAEDMLREFDPLAPEQHLNLSKCATLQLDEEQEKNDSTMRSYDPSDSKLYSAESSTSLSDSTDLNHYMDVTECNTGDTKSTDETAVLLDSASRCTGSIQNGKTTYEDLNNYLDGILNNSDDVSLYRGIKDKLPKHTKSPFDAEGLNQNERHTEKQGANLNQVASAQTGFLPEPLNEPLDSLQTGLFSNSTRPLALSNASVESKDDILSFLHECSISPVLHGRPEKMYDEKNHTFGLSHNIPLTNESISSKSPSSVKDRPFSLDSYTQKSGSSDGRLEAPPRLVRSNSYTLDSPSPLLLAHMEAELRKSCMVNTSNDKVKPATQSRTHSTFCNGRARRVWDVEKAKNSSSWYNKQNYIPNNQTKRDSCARTPRKVQIHNNVGHQSPVRALPPVMSSASSNSLPSSSYKASSKSSEDSEKSSNQIDDQRIGSACNSLDARNAEDLTFVLAKLQLQHTREMEELINRQRKEQEAVRLALLREQTSVATAVSGNSLQNSISKSGNTDILPSASLQTHNFCDSPPSKDRMERRNTSPSIQIKNTAELQRCLVQYNKSSSISVNTVSLENPAFDANLNDSIGPCHVSSVASSSLPLNVAHQITTHSSAECMSAGPISVQLNGSTSVGFSTQMIASFPPTHLQDNLKIDSMVASLPSNFEFLDNPSVKMDDERDLAISYGSLSGTVQGPHAPSPSSQRGSSITKRRSWCSRQLFCDESGEKLHSDSDWVKASHTLQKHAAAARIQAGVRGYLTRRLLKTERVQNCITTIRDTIVCALQLQKECAPHVEPSDLQLHGRLIQQLSAACEDLHNIFLGLPIPKRMALISADREWLRSRSSRSSSATGSRPLSRATQIALQRKFNQTDPVESSSTTRSLSRNHRARRRSWASTRSSYTAVTSAPASAPATARENRYCSLVSTRN